MTFGSLLETDDKSEYPKDGEIAISTSSRQGLGDVGMIVSFRNQNTTVKAMGTLDACFNHRVHATSQKVDDLNAVRQVCIEGDAPSSQPLQTRGWA